MPVYECRWNGNYEWHIYLIAADNADRAKVLAIKEFNRDNADDWWTVEDVPGITGEKKALFIPLGIVSNRHPGWEG